MWSSDTSRLANRTYDLLFDDKTDINYGNLKRIDCNNIPDFDVMIAGLCQTFSVIGRQEGIERSERSDNLLSYWHSGKEETKDFYFWRM